MQNAVYRDAIYRYRNKTKWLAIIDIDEYIVPVKKQNINEILRDFENYPGLGINWVMFDSNGLVSRPDKLVIEAYTRAESEDNLFLKTISQTEKVKYIFDSHFCFYYKKEHPVNENFEKVSSVISEPWSSKSKTHSSNKIRINHYHTKSYEDYIRKRLIGYADSNMQRPVVDGQIYARNYKRDYVIQKYLPTLKEKMGLK